MAEDEPEVPIETTAVEEPAPELAPAVDEFLPGELVVADPRDQHTAMVVMDNHDTSMLLEQIQGAALRKWVYKLPGRDGATGLTIHAVQDITQRMNWTGKAKIGVLPETLTVEEIVQDAGHGPEPFWVATIFAKDELTGAMLPGTAMEPQRMRLKEATANAKRDRGEPVPADNTVFDVFSRTKALAKATRNALAAFIPEEIEQTVIAMFEGDASRVERIQTEQEAKLEEMPPPLDDDEARELIATCERLYDEIKELGGGQGRVKFTPGRFSSWMLQSQHSHDALRRFVSYLEERKEQIPGELELEARQRKAHETVNEIPCPKCEAARFKYCKGIKGAHPERLQARLAQLEASA